jgi:hypothetical protein
MAATSGSRRVVIVGDGFADLFAAALVTGSQRQTFKRGQARQTRTTSANDRSHSLPPQPRPVSAAPTRAHERGSARRSRAIPARRDTLAIFTP